MILQFINQIEPQVANKAVIDQLKPLCKNNLFFLILFY